MGCAPNLMHGIKQDCTASVFLHITQDCMASFSHDAFGSETCDWMEWHTFLFSNKLGLQQNLQHQLTLRGRSLENTVM